MTKRSSKYEYHEFATETEPAQQMELDYQVEAESLLLDLKVLLREYYAATFTPEENALKLQFNNGQVFVVSIKEIK